MRGLGFGSERIGLLALRWPKCASVIVLTVLVLILTSLTQLRFDNDINRVFLSDSPLSDAQRQYETAQTPKTSQVVAYVKSSAPFTAAELTTLRNIVLDLEFLDGAVNVASPFVVRMMPDVNAPNGRPVFPVDIPENYQQHLDAFTAQETDLPTFLSDDLTAALISVDIDTKTTSLDAALLAIDAAFAAIRTPTISTILTGENVITREIVAGLKDDLIALNLWGGLIVIIAAFALLRDMRLALLAVVPAFCGAASVLALSVLLDYPITVLSNVVPILMLVLGVGDGVHLTSHLKTSGNDVADTIRRIGPACGLTALTTATAFASLMLISNEQVFEFAVLGALGAIIAFVMTVTIFALLARVTKLTDTPQPHFATRFASSLAGFGTARPTLTIALALVLLGVSTAGYLRTTPWFPLYQNLPDNSATQDANDAIARDFGGVFRMIIEVDNDWDKTQQLTKDLGAIAGPHVVLSEAGLARWLGDPTAEPTQAQLDDLPAALTQQLRPNVTTKRIFVLTPEPMRNDAALARFDALYAAAKQGGADRIIGLPTVMRHEAVRLISQLSWGLLAASLGATALVALAFRSLRLVTVLIVPNILPLMLTGASLHLWAAGQLSPTAVLALTIAFGIAIDDSVHFLNRFFQARAAGEPRKMAIETAIKTAGEVMVVTTALLSAGLCVTLFSGFFPIRLFGVMMIVTLWAALLIDLLLLPALLSRKEVSLA
jgi:predicted RND superfamily exporter protein